MHPSQDYGAPWVARKCGQNTLPMLRAEEVRGCFLTDSTSGSWCRQGWFPPRLPLSLAYRMLPSAPVLCRPVCDTHTHTPALCELG